MSSNSMFSLLILVGASYIALISAARDGDTPNGIGELATEHEQHAQDTPAAQLGSAVVASSRTPHWPVFTQEAQNEATIMWKLVSVAFAALTVQQGVTPMLAPLPCMDRLFPEGRLPSGFKPHAIELVQRFSAMVNNTQTAALIVKMDSATQEGKKDIVIVHPGTCGTLTGSTHKAKQLTKQATQLMFGTVDITDQGGTVVGNALQYWARAQGSLDEAVAAAVLNLAQEADWSHRIVVAGYSMGGAVASIEAASLLRRKNELFAKTDGTPHMSVYTFGSPRVADPRFAAHVDSLMAFDDVQWWRIVHGADPAPAFPPKSIKGRVHHGIEVWNPRASEYLVDDRHFSERAQTSATENPALSVSVDSTVLDDHYTYMGFDSNLCDHRCTVGGEEEIPVADMV